MRIEVRAAVRRDVERVLEIEAASFGRDAWDRALFLDALEECRALFLVAKRRGRIVGYSITCLDARRAELISIGVFPEARRHGVGRALMHSTAKALARRRMARWTLMVRVENEAAIRFYRGLGFRSVRTVPNYYGRGRDGLRMAKTNCVAATHPTPDSPQRRSHARL